MNGSHKLVETNMNDFELKLACLLASYEMDEPHIKSKNITQAAKHKDENDQYYPNITPDEFLKWLATDHLGDCTGLPSPCIRCLAECLAHKTKWIAARIKL